MLKKTPFHSEHEKLNAKLIDFGGFEMPVQYDGIKHEHMAVREHAGLFDVSHMGEFFVDGPEALNLIQSITINDASRLVPGKAQYTAMCYENGGLVDDLLVYMLDENRYMLVVNASNTEKDLEWIMSQNSMNAEIQNRSDEIALIALQGPKSVEILQQITDADVENIGFYSFITHSVAGENDVIISTTGYTGEKGFELYIDTTKSEPVAIWNKLLAAGKNSGLKPAGLGARDTLRLEMGYLLYGNDITENTTPLEAGMGWLAKFDKEFFIGKEALLKQKEKGISRKLTGFEITEDRKVARPGYEIFDENGKKIGIVTSGTQSISLTKGIGLGYIDTEKSAINSNIYINIRKKQVEAIVTRLPFLTK